MTTKNKHTPAPWRTWESGPAHFVVAENEQIVAITSRFGSKGGEDVTMTTRLSEAEANARLISAAPELLAALEATASKLMEYRQTGYTTGWDKPLSDARAAIAKATGEA